MSDLPALAQAQAAFARGDFSAAFEHAGHCLARTPNLLDAHALRVNAALQLQRWADAVPHLRLLIDAQPQREQFRRLLGVCLLRIGNAQRDAGEGEAAARSYRAALDAWPQNVDARFNLGVLLLESEAVDQAVALLREVRQAEPDNPAATLHLAHGLIKLGDDAGAVGLIGPLAQASADFDVLIRCAELFAEAADTDAALQTGLRAFHLSPAQWRRVWKLAGDWRLHGYLQIANALLDAMARDVQQPSAQFRIALARRLGLPLVYHDRGQLQAARSNYLAGLHALVREYPPERVRDRVEDAAALVWDNFFLAYQGEDDRAAQSQYGQWLGGCMTAILPQFAATPEIPPRTQPRIALVSSFFRECTVGSYFFSWVEHLARHGFEVVLFQLGPRFDAQTDRFAAAAGTLTRLEGDLPQQAQAIRAAQADLILYPELGMDSRVLALAALRLAPVQACAWGHPVTTGLPTIDAFLSCAEMEPTGAQAHYSERLVLLPGLGTRYASPPIPAPVGRARLGLPEQRTLYLLPQSPFKLHPDTDAVVLEVLQRDRNGLIVLFDGQTRGATRLLEQRLHDVLDAAGLDPGAHLRFLRECDRTRYLHVNQACDAMLDSLHWSGGNTTLDALHCGLPVVTCPGRFMRGRQSMAMLRLIGCDELIVDSPERLAEVAVAVANDAPRRRALSARIGAGLPALNSSDEPLRALAAAISGLIAPPR
jgi:CRISPR-associated protein Csy1